MDKLNKFTVDFTLTKHTMQETLRALFDKGKDEIKANKDYSELTAIEKYNLKQENLKRLSLRYKEFQDVREHAEGIAYPMALFVKELTKGESKLSF